MWAQSSTQLNVESVSRSHVKDDIAATRFIHYATYKGHIAESMSSVTHERLWIVPGMNAVTYQCSRSM